MEQERVLKIEILVKDETNLQATVSAYPTFTATSEQEAIDTAQLAVTEALVAINKTREQQGLQVTQEG